MNQKDYIIIYLHGNGGSRLDSLGLIPYCMNNLKMDLCTFDFTGCGKSEGHYVTLGLKEQEDLQSVINELILKYKYNKFVLFGMSMGAVTVFLFCCTFRNWVEKNVVCIILDSPFVSFKQLIYEFAEEKVKFGSILAGMSMSYVRDLAKRTQLEQK
ncbi:hypothetical protein IMG5_037460 [Ichthyophthirius multifiliis]|uniref:AB hydrolase-1 domain-containing protein n=1 Tax=Ichthyophthirius multifiliis TaxID=5932 RepID=G0QLV8_ICHMU|nr:hypothetical protein IMG5_037460 [Ichthyophthirius multifiliis]EGR33798.1 hypothetical protein IMG5_037460 [Ichthyophthirius multifiliis]|eukprot:XP_004039022.1 hypothetical protein IMG5_037460 [Ichthyophthirius multifiliis]